MGYFRQFEKFDPIRGSVPDYPFPALPCIARRARKLLTGRTLSELKSAAGTIDWMIEEYFRSEKESYIQHALEHGAAEFGLLDKDQRTEGGLRYLLDNWPYDESDKPFIADADNTRDLDALTEVIGQYVVTLTTETGRFTLVDDDDEFSNAHEYEYFAVLALWKVADAVSRLSGSRPDYSSLIPDELRVGALADPATLKMLNDQSIYQTWAANDALEAMEAICYAERLQATARLEDDRDGLKSEVRRLSEPAYLQETATQLADDLAKSKISQIASKAARKRHKENHAMKQEVWAWYEANGHQFSSVDKAAEAAVARDKLVPVTFRTVSGWISEYVRSQRSARRP